MSQTDTTQLESAILNIAINARDAMPEGGSLLIELDSVELDENYTAGYEDLSPGPYFQISITDTGEGMSPEIQAQVFDPFFTTKDVGEGTGLGLSMVHGFLKQCQGHVSLYSEPGKGTVMKLFLPPNPWGSVETSDQSITEEIRGSGEQILVVEDESEVRLLAVQLLDELGYKTVEAESAAGMSGVDLAEKARLTRPDLKVLFTSGYTREATQRWGTTGYELLEKPYTKIRLSCMLGKVLQEAPSTL